MIVTKICYTISFPSRLLDSACMFYHTHHHKAFSILIHLIITYFRVSDKQNIVSSCSVEGRKLPSIDLNLQIYSNYILHRFLVRGFTEVEKPFICLLEPAIKRKTHHDSKPNTMDLNGYNSQHME